MKLTKEILLNNGFKTLKSNNSYFIREVVGDYSYVQITYLGTPDSEWKVDIWNDENVDTITKVISDVEELKQCLSVMNVELKLKV